MCPRWYCSRVWRGDHPNPGGGGDQIMLEGNEGLAGGVVCGVGGAAANSGEVVIDDVDGRIVVNQLGTGTGKQLRILH